jgi:serine/threonine protein kinase/Tfp pilus assembly protein PilF
MESVMIGKTISHYKILEKLGEGGMGVVYKAEDTKLKRIVALKFLPINLIASQEEISRFEQEAEAISALNHPNVETIYDVDEVNGQKYIVLEYIPGGTLKSKLKQLKSEDKSFSIGEVLDYDMQMAEGLAHAHRRKIIHRDVKTENIMLTEEGKVKLTDFGLAKLRGTVQKTKTGSTLGTAAYMSPEQVRGEEVDHRSDIFSLGVVLYELATSHLPFQGEYEASLSYSILNEHPASVKSLRPDAPQALEKIINRCLEKDKTKRYQRADEIVADLRALQQEISGSVTISVKHSKLPWVVAAVVVVLAVIFIILFYPRSGPSPASRKSIAVLPFKNMSDSKEDEYFADGITEDIIAQISNIGELRVISRTSVMPYKNSGKNLRGIAKELNVASVLEGSVRRSGNQVRIVAQLINAVSDEHLWAQTYDKELTQIFAIQSDVAQSIAAALKTKLLPEEKERIEKKQTENMEAYQLYLKGRYYWNKRSPEEMKKGIKYFEQAIEEDPSYALAYVGLSDSYATLGAIEYGGLPPKEIIPKAKSAALNALEIDKTLAEAYTSLANIRFDYEWDWSGAEKEFKQAIELNPNYAIAHHWYSHYLAAMGRLDEALFEEKRALDLDPLSLIINTQVGMVFYYSRQYDQAIEQYQKTLEMDPHFVQAHLALGLAYVRKAMVEEAVAEFQKVFTLSGGNPVSAALLAYTYAVSGKRSEALEILDGLLETGKKQYVSSFYIALIYLGLGERDLLYKWLEKAYDERSNYLVYLKVEPLASSLSSDPKFTALLKKMGLEK